MFISVVELGILTWVPVEINVLFSQPQMAIQGTAVFGTSGWLHFSALEVAT